MYILVWLQLATAPHGLGVGSLPDQSLDDAHQRLAAAVKVNLRQLQEFLIHTRIEIESQTLGQSRNTGTVLRNYPICSAPGTHNGL